MREEKILETKETMNSPGQCELGRDGKKVEEPGSHLGDLAGPGPSVFPFLRVLGPLLCWTLPEEACSSQPQQLGGGTLIITAACLEKQRSPSDLPSWLRADFLVDLSSHPRGARLLGISHLPDLGNPTLPPPCTFFPQGI